MPFRLDNLVDRSIEPLNLFGSCGHVLTFNIRELGARHLCDATDCVSGNSRSRTFRPEASTCHDWCPSFLKNFLQSVLKESYGKIVRASMKVTLVVLDVAVNEGLRGEESRLKRNSRNSRNHYFRRDIQLFTAFLKVGSLNACDHMRCPQAALGGRGCLAIRSQISA